MHTNDEEGEKQSQIDEHAREIENERQIGIFHATERQIRCGLTYLPIVQFDENGNRKQYVVNRCGHIFDKDTYDDRIQLRDSGHGGQDGMFCLHCESELDAWPFSQTQEHWPINFVWPEQENPSKKKKRD